MEGVDILYSGRVLTIRPERVESDTEFQYRLRHSLVSDENPLSLGMSDTYHVNGMLYQQPMSRESTDTGIIRRVFENELFRDALIQEIQQYYPLPVIDIIRLIPKESTDRSVLERLNRTTRRVPRVTSDVSRILSRIPHIPIVKSLDVSSTVEIRSDKRYELITAMNTLHQRENIDDLYHVLAPGGLLIIRETDYRDLTPISVLRQEKMHIDHTQEENPYRQYLDASSLMMNNGRVIPGTYRSRMEWHCMLIKRGFKHICTSSPGLDTPSSQMMKRVNPDMSWIKSNPHRTFTGIYTKDGDRTDHIIEYLPRTNINTESIFPRGHTVRSGINYDDEILSYITPWYKAQRTSMLISEIMKKEYGQSIKYRLFDGTGGAGGNALGFISNTDIQSLHIYERYERFAQFLIKNIELYTGKKARTLRDGSLVIDHRQMTIYITNGELQSGQLESKIPTVLFLDVPWITEGCRYKLYGYTYEGVTLEEYTLKVLRMGVKMVVLKLPDHYRLEIRHQNRESLYIITQKSIQRRTTDVSTQRQIEPVKTSVTNPAHEVLRYTLMSYIRSIYTSGNYLLWLYQRLQRSPMDPVIPKISSEDEQISLPEMSYDELSSLIRARYPTLIPQLERTFFLDTAGQSILRDNVIVLMKRENQEMTDVIDRIYRTYQSSVSDKIDVSIQMRQYGDTTKISLQMNSQLKSVISQIKREISERCIVPESITLPTLTLNSLRKKYLSSTGFESALVSMLIRYSILIAPTRNISLVGIWGSQRIPPSFTFTDEMFVSPMSAVMPSYLSLFPDTDRQFGSRGSLSSHQFKSGSFIGTPLIESDIERMNDLMKSDIPLSFFIVLQKKGSTLSQRVRQSPWKRFELTTVNLIIVILQSDSGVEKYPIPETYAYDLVLFYN